MGMLYRSWDNMDEQEQQVDIRYHAEQRLTNSLGELIMVEQLALHILVIAVVAALVSPC